jgi:hypothetical protein
MPVPKLMVEVYAKELLDLMDSMGIDRANIEGESLGGSMTNHRLS